MVAADPAATTSTGRDADGGVAILARLGGRAQRSSEPKRVTITVAGRPAALLGPVSSRTWREWDDLAGVFDQPTDTGWAGDRDLLEVFAAG
ncbi:hypothetical protein AB0M35_28355 [Micromonospora sp. NPDC051196]|uniref:hypothetical protein n=1 Tax=Micromonospora sp. NPDC051196 TaxID=3155281 RepID=UPI0034336AA4